MTDELIEEQAGSQTETQSTSPEAMPLPTTAKAYKFLVLEGECEIYGHAKFTRFGDSKTLPESVFRDAVLGGAQLLPAEEFDQIFGSQFPPLVDKLRSGWGRVAAYRAQFEGGNV